MPTVLITGASRGIGLEFARQYADAGWRVIATCRNPADSDFSGDVRRLDVTDEASVATLSEALAGDAVDLLVNNAGVYGPRSMTLERIDYAAWDDVLQTNVLGAMRVAAALAPAVARSGMKKMAFLSSRMGSIADNGSGGEYVYRSSKAALNMAVRSFSIDLSEKGVICLLFHPGWVKTDMGGPSASIDATTSVAGMRAVIDRATAADSGRFFNYDGTELPW